MESAPGTPGQGPDNKARTETVTETLQGLTKYNETNTATNQNCTNITALLPTNPIRGYLILGNSPRPV